MHMLAVAALLPRHAVLRLRAVPYWHQGTVLLPGELRPAARVLLGDLPLPTFSVTDRGEDADLHKRDVDDIEYLAECDEGAQSGLSPRDAAAAAVVAAAAQREADEAAELEALLA